MISVNALDRGTGLRRLALDVAGAMLQAGSALIERPCAALGACAFLPGETDGGRLVVRHGLPLLETSGDPHRTGTASGELLARPTRRLLSVMRLFPPLVAARLAGRAQTLAAGIAPEHRVELGAWARAAGVAEDDLLLANVVVDTCCSALVAEPAAGRPLMVGRNMDFFPAALLGRATVLSLVRSPDRLAFASLGWPGYTAVISGLNERGLCAMILLNYAATARRPGTPIAYRAREVLERCADVEEAAALFAASPVASSHYLLLADQQRAAVVWQHGGTTHRHDPRAGWLACSNGRRDHATGLAEDDRGRHLHALAARRAAPDDAWLRSAVAASHLKGINTQAMLFVPERRIFQIAVGDAMRPAAGADWLELDLAAAFAGDALAEAPLRRLGHPASLPHYTAHAPATPLATARSPAH
jgi:hypothetical protein